MILNPNLLQKSSEYIQKSLIYQAFCMAPQLVLNPNQFVALANGFVIVGPLIL